MNPAVVIFLVILVVGFAVAINLARMGPADSLLNDWASENNYRLVDYERSFRTGPFFFTTSRVQVVYRITVEDEAGQQRIGWARCGGALIGLLSDRVVVKWDDFQS